MEWECRRENRNIEGEESEEAGTRRIVFDYEVLQ